MPTRPLVFRPHLQTRIACALPILVPSLLVGVDSATSWQSLDASSLIVVTAFVTCGVWLAVRCFQMSVTIGDRTVTVRGVLRVRTVARSDVEALLDGDVSLPYAMTPTLYWQDETGKPARTRLWMFGDPRYQLGDVTGHNQRVLRRLRRSLGISGLGDRRLRR